MIFEIPKDTFPIRHFRRDGQTLVVDEDVRPAIFPQLLSHLFDKLFGFIWLGMAIARAIIASVSTMRRIW